MSYDAIIIGGSFGGLSAAMQLARARRRILVIDAGRPRNRFSKVSHGFLGQDGKPIATILEEGIRQLRTYPTVEFVTGEVQAVGKTEAGFIVTSSEGREERGSRLVLATGLVDELPLIPGLQERWGKTVLHCPYCHGYEVGGRPIGVLANHPMSAHQATLLSDWGPIIYFTQGIFEPDSVQAKSLADRQVQVEHTPVVEILGTSPEIESVRLEDGRRISLAAIFTATRTHMASPLAEQLGCDFDEGPSGRYLRVDDWKQTSVAGVFAAGDVALPMHNATLASAAGVTAGVGAHQSLIFHHP